MFYGVERLKDIQMTRKQRQMFVLAMPSFTDHPYGAQYLGKRTSVGHCRLYPDV